MKKIIATICITLLFTSSLNAQVLNNSSVFVDFAKFKFNEDTLYVEVYYSISAKALKISEDNGQPHLKAEIQIKINNEDNSEIVSSRNYSVDNILLGDIEQSLNRFLTGLVGFSLAPGKYNLIFSINDLNNEKNKHVINFPFEIQNFSNEGFSISDIQLCSNIIENSENRDSYFYKNSYETFPNPSTIFGEGLPTLFYYTELYNLQRGENKNPLKLMITIFDYQGKEKSRKEKFISRKFNSIVEVGALNIAKYPSGSYTLVLTLVDTVSRSGIVSSKRFFIYNTQVKEEIESKFAEADILSSEFNVMSQEELNSTFAMSRYIASAAEIDQWDKIADLEGKKNFLFKFWKQRSPDPLSPKNERKIEYFNRVKRSNEQFTTPRMEGWKSDRGRVYIIYGEPSEIDRYPSEMDAYPYEIWSYHHIEGGVIFVFGDITGLSQMQLLHSTHRGELRNENWFNRVKKIR
jgi:GWxTD domain-containing protein